MKIKIKKLKPDCIIPTYAHFGDAGLDLYALENDQIEPGQIKRIDFGFALELPNGFVALTRDRSSFGKIGIHNLGGVFDCGYRGEYNCTLINLNSETYQIKKGDKVTQLVIFPVACAELEETDDLSQTSRGAGRFGSTDR
ncbi:MAG: dUTP diphosphatase [Patescibacteria group bacterium]|jgi:dUTP pyrophosphatase